MRLRRSVRRGPRPGAHPRRPHGAARRGPRRPARWSRRPTRPAPHLRRGGRRWWTAGPAASPPASEPGDRVVLATANGYEQFLLTLAASRAGRLPAPVNSQMSPGEIDHVVADSGATLVVRSAPTRSADADPLGPAVARRPRRRRRALLHVGHHRQAQGRPAHPPGPARRHVAGRALLPSRLAARRGGRRPAGRPHLGLHRRGRAGLRRHPGLLPAPLQPGQVLDAIESAGPRVRRRAGHVPDAAGGRAPRTATSARCGCGSPAPTPCPPSSPPGSRGSAPPSTLPFVGPVGEAIFAEGYGMVETGGGVAVRVSPPLLPTAPRRRRSGCRCRATVQGGRRGRRRGAGGRRRRAAGPGPGRAQGVPRRRRRPPPPRSPTTAGCAPATWPGAGRSA